MSRARQRQVKHSLFAWQKMQLPRSLRSADTSFSEMGFAIWCLLSLQIWQVKRCKKISAFLLARAGALHQTDRGGPDHSGYSATRTPGIEFRTFLHRFWRESLKLMTVSGFVKISHHSTMKMIMRDDRVQPEPCVPTESAKREHMLQNVLFFR